MINFGDVFRYNNEECYVYLIQIDDIIYAAKILNKELTNEFVRLQNRKSRNPLNRTHEKSTFCFVILTTDEFSDQAAHYGSPQMPTDISDKMQKISTLNTEDIELLKKEIGEDIATYPILRETLLKILKDR